MKALSLICLMLISFSGFSQSKKKMNLILSAQHDSIKKVQDSLYELNDRIWNENNRLREDIADAGKKLNYKRESLPTTKNWVLRLKVELEREGFDAGTLVSETEVNRIAEAISSRDYTKELEGFQQVPELHRIKPFSYVPDEKIKVQNAMLQAKISEYRLANDQFVENIAAQEKLEEKLLLLKSSALMDIQNAIDIKSSLEEKVAILQHKQMELMRKKEEERLKAEEAAELAAKKKGKNKSDKVVFIPPVVTDEYIDEMDSGKMYNEDTQAGGWPETVKAEPVIPVEEQIYTIVEESPEFPGGMQALKTFLDQNLRYPEIMRELGLSGRCYIKFRVSEKGELSEVKILRGVADCPECDNEAVRVVKSMPRWTPGKIEGKPVNCWFTLPITFKLN